MNVGCSLVILWVLLFAAAPAARAADERADAGLFVAVGYGGRRVSSRDGLNWENDQRWSDEAKDDDHVLFNVAFGLGRFIAVGGGANVGRILSTRDGVEWKTVKKHEKGWVTTIAFGNGRFVATHGGRLIWSDDGETWNAGEIDLNAVRARRSAFGSGEGGSRFVIIGEAVLGVEKKRVSWRASTEDGVTFTSTAVDTPSARDVAHGSGHFVVVGPDGLIESSHDGHTWTRREAAPGEDFSRIVWTGKRFLVSGGTTGWSSPDGLTWTRDAVRIPCSLAWASEELAIGFSWGGNVHTSRDFRTWLKATVPPGPSLEAVAFAPQRSTP